MDKTTVAVPVAGVLALAGGVLAGRRKIERWRSNPDPLDGQPVRFPAAATEAVLTDDGAEIATYRAGAGPMIVLVHGLTSSHHDWGPIAGHLLDAGHEVLAIDQRGHGNSTVGTRGFGSRQLGDDLATVFATLDIKAACIIGHSMGAMAAMGYAASHPQEFADRVGSFVSVASSGSTDSVRQAVGLRLGGISIPDTLNRISARRLRIITGTSVFGKRPSLNMVDEAIESFRRCPDPVRSAATTALVDHDLLDELGTLTVPALVIGAGRDQLISADQIHELHETFPDSRLHIYPEAGHMVIWERHRDIADRVCEFVQSVVASPIPVPS